MQLSVFFHLVGCALALNLPDITKERVEGSLSLSRNKDQSLWTSASYDTCQCSESPPNLKPRQGRFQIATSRYDITLVTTSVGESDKLQQSLKCNKEFVNRTIVITTPSDTETQRVCFLFGVRCHVTDAFRLNNDKFNKGRALREVQLELHREASSNSVAMIIDSDVCLPPNFLELLPSEMPLDVLFSVNERCMFATPQDYSRGWPALQAKWSYQTMGFLQMYIAHSSAPTYPEDFPTAARSDLEFGTYFKQRKVLPIIVMHMGISPGGWMAGSKNTSGADSGDTWASAALPPDGACPCCSEKTTRCIGRKCSPLR